MSRIFKRPMFRRGGNVMEGIMTGIQDRSNYAEQGVVNSKLEQQKKDLSQSMDLASYLTKQMGKPDYLAQALISGGLRAVGGAGAGKGKLAELATAFAPAVEQAFQGQQRARDTKLGLGLELFKGLKSGKELAEFQYAEKLGELREKKESGQTLSSQESALLESLEARNAQGNMYLKTLSRTDAISKKLDSWEDPDKVPDFVTGMDDNEKTNLATWLYDNRRKTIEGDKEAGNVMSNVFPKAKDLVPQENGTFKLNRTDKFYIDKFTSGGIYYIPSIDKKTVFDKTTLTFKIVE